MLCCLLVTSQSTTSIAAGRHSRFKGVPVQTDALRGVLISPISGVSQADSGPSTIAPACNCKNINKPMDGHQEGRRKNECGCGASGRGVSTARKVCAVRFSAM